jgi:Tfp pilus assembly protein PilN
MIEINLLPGSGRKAKARGAAGANIGAQLSEVFAKVKDPYLIGAVLASILAVGGVAGAFWYQSKTGSDLALREQKASQDSIRYSAVLKDRKKAEAKRDSVVYQLGIIRSIDNNRFVWPHIMQEIARVLPSYTWLTSVQQTSPTPTAASMDAAAKGTKDKAAVTTVPIDTMRFQIIGNTVDIQALTHFIRQLEASAFIQNVQISRSDLTLAEGKEITEFTLNAEFQWPDSSAIRTVPVTISTTR